MSDDDPTLPGEGPQPPGDDATRTSGGASEPVESAASRPLPETKTMEEALRELPGLHNEL